MEDGSSTPTEAIATLARAADVTVAVAESLTGGALSCALAAAEESSLWYRGGVVAYSEHVKVAVLQVTPGPVVTARCAHEMARGVALLLGADLAIATTGVGGPGPEEGHAAGTVFLGWFWKGESGFEEHFFSGAPDAIVSQTVQAGIALGERLLRRT